MLGKKVRYFEEIEEGDILLEQREKYKGLEGKIIAKYDDRGVDIEIVKKPNKNKDNFVIGEVFFFGLDDIRQFFLKKVNKNSIKKL